MIRALEQPRAFKSPFHSQGTLATDVTAMALVSGQVGVRPDGSRAYGIVDETTVAMQNVVAVLAEGGLTMRDVVSLRVHVTDHDHIAAFVEAASPFLPQVRPASTLLVVESLADPSLVVQIEAIAVR